MILRLLIDPHESTANEYGKWIFTNRNRIDKFIQNSIYSLIKLIIFF